MFSLFLFIFPIFVSIISLYLYRFIGKKDFFKLDLVQFIYTFIIFPLFFLWLKTIFYLSFVQNVSIGVNTKFFIFDSVLSLSFLYMFSMVVIHSLTKTFNLKKNQNKDYDIFLHSEDFHLVYTHIGAFLWFVVISIIISIINMFFPLNIENINTYFDIVKFDKLLILILSIVIFYIYDAVLNYTKIKQAIYKKLLFFLITIWFIVNIVLFFIFTPEFGIKYIFYFVNTLANFLLLFKRYIKNLLKRIKK